jgi:hypothetical protein
MLAFAVCAYSVKYCAFITVEKGMLDNALS